jgi:hypothetical protein
VLASSMTRAVGAKSTATIFVTIVAGMVGAPGP